MNANETESLLRESLQAHLNDVGPVSAGGDPWLRVSQAHRRSRRRRTGAVGALVAVALIGGTIANAHTWPDLFRTSRPPVTDNKNDNKDVEGNFWWQKVDDGKPRGALGNDPGLRQDVVAALQNPVPQRSSSGNPLPRPDSVHVLWADVVGGRRFALVTAELVDSLAATPTPVRTLAWVGGEAGRTTMTTLTSGNTGNLSTINALKYTDSGGSRVLAVVERGATVTQSRTVIGTDGKLRRDWKPVTVQDGVVDIPFDDPAGRGPLFLRATVGKRVMTTSTESFGVEQLGNSVGSFITPAERATALRGARGPGIALQIQEGMDVRNGGIDQGLNGLINGFASDAAHTAPRVEWAGEVSAARGGGTLAAFSAGLPHQGRLLNISRTTGKTPGKGGAPAKSGFREWNYSTPVPAAGLPNTLIWRVHTPFGVYKPTGQVVGWFFPNGVTSVEVIVDGEKQQITTQDGMGWIKVDPTSEVTVTAHGLPGGGTVTKQLHPDDVEPNVPPGASSSVP